MAETRNTKPIFPGKPRNAWSPVVITAVNFYDGDLSGAAEVFTADADHSTRLDKVRILSLGTNAATVARLYINNGSSAAVATNNSLLKEVTIAATTASATLALAETTLQIDELIQAGYKLLFAIGTTGTAGFKALASIGDFTKQS
jgi:hypothetical protein